MHTARKIDMIAMLLILKTHTLWACTMIYILTTQALSLRSTPAYKKGSHPTGVSTLNNGSTGVFADLRGFGNYYFANACF